MTLQEISDKILSTKGKIAIFGHVHPDCDCVGSMTALAFGLKQFGKECDLFVDGKLSDSQSEIYIGEKLRESDFNEKNYKLLIILDLNESYRLGKFQEQVVKAKNKLRIDHHQGTDTFIKDCYLDSKSSSTCEIMYDLLKIMKVKIDSKIATYLYSGIATDTNSFINSNVRANTYKVAEILYKKGANVALVNRASFKSKTKSGIALTKILYKKQKFAFNDRLAYVVINQKDFKKSCTTYLDAENFSQLLDSIYGVDIAVCATERQKGLFKLSIRSNNSENNFALSLAKAFDGGGHNQAAGATVKAKSDKQVEKLILQNVGKILEK